MIRRNPSLSRTQVELVRLGTAAPMDLVTHPHGLGTESTGLLDFASAAGLAVLDLGTRSRPTG